jgi:hypothetical protein
MMLRIGLLLLVFPSVVLMGVFFYEQMQISDCLAGGGYWDYLQSVCDQQSHPFIPLMARKPLLVNGGMLLSCLGLLITIVGLYRRRM